MITPGFFGLFNAHRGLIAAQNAMNTINHNITNANTPGYSRQQVDLTEYLPYQSPTLQSINAGQMGQGVTVSQITRSRDQFLDAQYRLANGVLGMNTDYSSALQQIEGIINEPTTSGLNQAMQSFFNSAQAMSQDPQNVATSQTFVQQAMDMVTQFQQQASALVSLRQNLVGDPNVPGSLATSQLSITTTQVNDLLTQITSLNKSIVTVTASGAKPNDLMDQRDALLDQLSKLADIQVTNLSNNQINLSIAGQSMIQGVNQLDSLQVVTNPGPAPSPANVPTLLQTKNGGVVLNDGTAPDIGSGTLKGILDMADSSTTVSSIPNVLGKLDTLINTIATQVNALQTTGRDQYGNLGAANPIFVLNPALNPTQALNIFHWQVNPPVQADPKLVATAADDPTAPGNYNGIGDGSNALKIAQLNEQNFPALGTSFSDYFNGIVSKLGVDAKSYQDATTAQGNLLQSVDTRRQSISGVNTDEEMIDLLRYQRAFEATSKTISAFSDVYKTIINMVG